MHITSNGLLCLQVRLPNSAEAGAQAQPAGRAEGQCEVVKGSPPLSGDEGQGPWAQTPHGEEPPPDLVSIVKCFSAPVHCFCSQKRESSVF